MKVTITLTEDQASAVREMVMFKRFKLEHESVEAANIDYFNKELAYIKRLETTLVKQLAKS